MFKTKGNLDFTINSVSLRHIFDEYYDRLVYFSFQLVKNKQQSEDIVQEAFIKYWDNHTSVKLEKLAIKNYLYTTVRNLSFNVLRHHKVVQNYAETQSRDEPIDLPVIEAIISSEVLAEIHLAIHSLPENYKIISLKSFLEGKKNQEIADELGMSINTVKKQKQRALQLLRLKLSSDIFIILLWLSAD